MDNVVILERIRKAEESAQLVVSNAEEEYRRELDRANKQAEEITAKAKIKADAIREFIIAKAKLEEEEETAKMEEKHKREISSMGRVDRNTALTVFESAVRDLFGV